MKKLPEVLILFFAFQINIYSQSISDYLIFIEKNGEIESLPYEIDINRIDSYSKYLFASYFFKSISELAAENNLKYNSILNFIPENEDITKYYYSKAIIIEHDEKTIQIDLSEYKKNISLYLNDRIVGFEYSIYHVDYFYATYELMQPQNGFISIIFGDPTGKCFKIAFAEDGYFLGKRHF